MTDEQVREYLSSNGYPEHVVRAGREGLVAMWRKFVDDVARGYRFGLEDYRNDLDTRAILRLIGVDDAVREDDARLERVLTSREVRVWESGDGEPWWDFGYPANASGDLLDDLKAEGLAE